MLTMRPLSTEKIPFQFWFLLEITPSGMINLVSILNYLAQCRGSEVAITENSYLHLLRAAQNAKTLLTAHSAHLRPHSTQGSLTRP